MLDDYDFTTLSHTDYQPYEEEHRLFFDYAKGRCLEDGYHSPLFIVVTRSAHHVIVADFEDDESKLKSLIAVRQFAYMKEAHVVYFICEMFMSTRYARTEQDAKEIMDNRPIPSQDPARQEHLMCLCWIKNKGMRVLSAAMHRNDEGKLAELTDTPTPENTAYLSVAGFLCGERLTEKQKFHARDAFQYLSRVKKLYSKDHDKMKRGYKDALH